MKKVIERCGFGDQAYFCILLGFRCCALVKKINILHLFPQKFLSKYTWLLYYLSVTMICKVIFVKYLKTQNCALLRQKSLLLLQSVYLLPNLDLGKCVKLFASKNLFLSVRLLLIMILSYGQHGFLFTFYSRFLSYQFLLV